MIPNSELQQLVELSRNTVVSTNVMAETLKVHDNLIKGLLKQSDATTLRVNELGKKVTDLELNYEITDEQRKMINTRARARVIGFIGYPSPYFRVVINNCYSFLRANHHLGSTISTTKRRNYDYVMEGIAAWHPDIEALKARKDEADAESRKHEAKIDKMVNVALVEQEKERIA